MDIVKISFIGIIGSIISLFFVKTHKEYALFVSVVSALIILTYLLKYAYSIVDVINTYSIKANVDMLNIKALFKVIAVSYIGQFASELCCDSGNNILGSKVAFLTKIMILFFSLPLIVSLFSYIEEVL